MDPDEFRWRQVQQLNEFLRLIGTQGMVWFAFGCTINGTAAWAVLKSASELRTNIIPSIVVVSDVMAAAACVLLICYYVRTSRRLRSLVRHITAAMDLESESTMPAFPVNVYCAISVMMLVNFLLLTGAWIAGIWLDVFRG